MKITEANHIHFTGIKGVGLTSVALMAKDLGIKVTGSDVAEEFITDAVLERNGIVPEVGFDSSRVEDQKPDYLVFTGAHGGVNNPEVLKAKELGIQALSHFEAVAAFAQGKKVIAVCGVGGKTTTTAMLATILEHAGLNPSWTIGVSDIPSLPNPGHYDTKGEYFIVEADEYVVSVGVDNRPKFSLLDPYIIAVTNIVHDHPDVYPTFEDTKRAYIQFLNKVPQDGLIVVNGDNQQNGEVIHALTTKAHIHTYGFNMNTNWPIEDLAFKNQQTLFSIGDSPDVILNVPGKFNVHNAAAAFITSHLLGLKEEKCVEGLKQYVGCKRRFEKVGEVNGVLLYDDYAHHPDEIKATLKATRDWFPDARIWVYFQPHTYSRTKALLPEFGKAFNDADFVGIDTIFASAREAKDESINSQMLVDEIKKHHPTPDNVNHVERDEETKILSENLKPGDIFITMGAGDIYKVHKDLIKHLSSRTE